MGFLDIVEKSVNVSFAYWPQPIPSREQMARVKLVAHRGAYDHKKGILENTDAAFKRAEALGCDGLELDIHATKDGVWLVNHDSDLKRLWNMDQQILESTFDEIRKSQPNILLLSEVVERYGSKMHLFIELKAPVMSESLYETLKGLEPRKNYHLISLNEKYFENLVGFERSAMLLVASHSNTTRFCQLSLEKGYGGVLGHYLLLRKHYINALHQMSQMAGVGFVDSKQSLYREVNRGIEWIFTNNAEALSPVLRR